MLFLLYQTDEVILNSIKANCLSSEDHKEFYDEDGNSLLESIEGISKLTKIYLDNPWSIIFFGMTKMLLDFANNFNGPFSTHPTFSNYGIDNDGDTDTFLMFNKYWDFTIVRLIHDSNLFNYRTQKTITLILCFRWICYSFPYMIIMKISASKFLNFLHH